MFCQIGHTTGPVEACLAGAATACGAGHSDGRTASAENRQLQSGFFSVSDSVYDELHGTVGSEVYKTRHLCAGICHVK